MKVSTLLRACVVALLALGPLSFADSAAMHLTGIGNGTAMGGVYVNPYNATINGTTTFIICDDFFAHSYLNEAWTANVTAYNLGLAPTKWGAKYGQAQASVKYDEAAWLADQLLADYTASPTGAERLQQSHISFAIWGIFESGALNYLAPGDQDAVTALIQDAQTNYKAGAYGDYRIYTPACTLGCSDPPQEFLVKAISTTSTTSISSATAPHKLLSPLKVPEAPAFAILAIDFSALAGLIGALRKRLLR